MEIKTKEDVRAWLVEYFGGDTEAATIVLRNGIKHFQKVVEHSRNVAEVQDAKEKLNLTNEMLFMLNNN